MTVETIQKRFEEMGARVKIQQRGENAALDIRKDRLGEYFDITVPNIDETTVLDIQPEDRHLVLMIRAKEGRSIHKDKYLCGHDERSWFVAAVPQGGVSTVKTAKAALQPESVRRQVRTKGVKETDRFAHENEAFIRQGEWYFVPVKKAVSDLFNKKMILKNEPLIRVDRRGAVGKPHVCEFLYREGGEVVWLSLAARQGISTREYQQMIKSNPGTRNMHWETRRVDMVAYAKGKIKHPDHRTIELKDWHRVYQNEERRSRAMQSVRFMD